MKLTRSKQGFEQWYINKIEELGEAPMGLMYMPTEDSNQLSAMLRIYREYKNEH